jgi:hypothetical protein
MVIAAGGVEALAQDLAISRQNLHATFTALRNLHGPSRMLAAEFARVHGISARLYIHPKVRGAFLVSMADGWWSLGRSQKWRERVPSTRSESDDWSHLGDLELPFTRLGEILRQNDK